MYCSAPLIFLSYLQEIGEKLSEIGGRLDYPLLNKELVQDVRKLWEDQAIQVFVSVSVKRCE